MLHFLAGVETLDERLSGLVKPLTGGAELVPSQRSSAERIAAAWSEAAGRSALPAVQLCAAAAAMRAGQRAIAPPPAPHLGSTSTRFAVAAVPAAPAELEGLDPALGARGGALGSALLLDAAELDAGDAAREGALARLTEELRGPLLVARASGGRRGSGPSSPFDVRAPDRRRAARPLARGPGPRRRGR